MNMYSLQVNVNLAGLPALVLPCGFVEGGTDGLPVGLQMIGAAFDEVCKHCFQPTVSREVKGFFSQSLINIKKVTGKM